MNRNIRDYEVSVWTLQDSFITVLKHSGTDNKGRIEEPDFDLKNDGTLTFKFSIPMYLKENNVKIENPIWYNTTNGNIIADLRKIKVIFHKNTEYEHIFELLITKVTESHEGFQLTCDVECESLAFHELGKSGYKLSLNQDTFIDYWTKWANGEIIGNEPKSNIKFWSDKVIEGTDWECEVQMDWSGYDTSRASNIIYEDAYAAAWDVSNEDKFIPTTVVQSKEKERLIDVEESNRYNITQTIAETFGVHCRYEYEHDSDYHITARKIIFYNAFVQEALGPIDINYAYDTTDISREMDSKDTITKMYVKTLTDSNTESGLATIADTAANKSQEDYLLNFDYLYSIGTISQEQYDAVEPYEIKMHQLNEELKGYERQISALENQKIDAAAAEAVAKNAVSLDNERISANNDLLNAITNGTGFVEVGSARPDSCAAIQTGSTYYINIRQKGIDPTTLHLYTVFTPGQALESNNEIKTYILENDEFGNLIKIKNIVANFPSQSKIIYVTYKYSPHLYYENILKTWERRLIKDTNDYTYYHNKVEDIDNELGNLKEYYKNTLSIKEEVIQRFERLMGPAIREGYWQPEDEYAKYGEKHREDNLNLSNISSFNNNNLASIGWDSELFDEEEKNYFDITVTQEPQYYHCIDLRGHLSDFTDWADNLSQISFIYRNTTLSNGASEDDVRYLSILPFGSQALLRFLQPKSGGEVIPVLMLVGLNVNNYSESVHNPRIGILTTKIQDSQIVTKVEEIISNTDIRLISNPENYNIVYPRIKINSSFLKNTEDSLVLKNNNVVINNYEDYYVLNRLENDSDLKYFITIKPELIFKEGEYGTYTCLYELSNVGLFIYLDALQVLKENAYPRVSYEIKPTFVNDEFIRYAYKYLNYIVHINDPELKFEYVKGYITELHLKLDSPKDDTITIDNYKTKFEDLFSTIVVQTEEMKKNSTLIGMAAQAFTPYGGLQPNLVQTVMDRVDLNYAFNNGTLTINEEDGIWGTSDSGVVAFRGGGIFTATEKDDNDEWIWNTGILPSGINASLITTGQLDTNLIRVFAGDDLKFQLNGEGLFAYKSNWSNTPLTVDLILDNKGTIITNNSATEINYSYKVFIPPAAQSIIVNIAETEVEGIYRELENDYYSQRDYTFEFYDEEDTLVTTRYIHLIMTGGVVSHPSYPNTSPQQNNTPFIFELGHWTQTYQISDLNEDNKEVSYIKISKSYIGGFANENISIQFILSEILQDLDYGQYVVHNSDGLFLTAKGGSKTPLGETLNQDVNRVAISWDGLTLRNWNNEKVFYADANTGNLTVEGTIRAKELLIIDEDSGSSATDIDTYINGKIADNPSDFLTVDSETITNLQSQIDGEIDTWFYVGMPHPAKYINEIGETIIETNLHILPNSLETEWGIHWDNGYSTNDLDIIERHKSDVYYDIGTPAQSSRSGRAYRFVFISNNEYYWDEIADTATTAALAAAAEAKTAANNAQNTADSKIRTFYASQKNNVVEKTPNIENINFNDGDLWVNASDNNNLYRYNVINQQWIKADKKIIQIERQYKRWHPTNFGWGPPMDEETADADNPAGAPDTGKRWEELLYGGANNEKTSSQNAGITKWSTDYPGFLDKILYSWIQADPKEKFYPDITIEDENYVVYTRNKITWDDNTITYTVPQLNMNLNDTEVKAFNIKNGNDNGIDFSIPSTNNKATVQINRDVGIKVTDDNQNYFQTTATQMGFFNSNDDIKMGYNGQDFLVKGTIYADGGKIGYSESDSNAGWTIGTNSLYSGNASSFDANNGIYLGTGGLSVSGNNYKVHFNTPEFLINVDEGNTILQIDKTGAVMKNLIVTDNLIAPNLNGAIYNGSNTIYIGTTNDCDYTRLDECANMLNNKILLQDVTIYIKNEIAQNNDYPKATFSGITGSGNIHIIGYNDEIQIIRQQLEIINCFITIDFSYIKFIERFYSRLILISGSKMVSFSDCVFWGVVLLENNLPTDRCTETLITVDNGSKVFFTSCEFELAKTYIRGYPGTEIIIINSGFNLYKLPNESNNSYTGITVNRSNWRSFIINGVNLKIKSNDTKIDENLGTKWNYQYQKIDCETVIERYMAVDYFYSSILYTYQGDETTSGMDYTPASQSIDTVEKTKNDLKPSTKNTAYITNGYWENNNNSGWNNDTTNLSQGYVYNPDNSRTYGNIGCVWFNLGFLQDKTITGGKLYFSRAQGAGQQTNGITTTIKILKITTPTNFSYNNNNFGTYSFSESSILWNQPVVINLSTAFIEELYNNGNPYAIAFVANDENYNFNDHKYSRNYCKIPISSISLTITYR